MAQMGTKPGIQEWGLFAILSLVALMAFICPLAFRSTVLIGAVFATSIGLTAFGSFVAGGIFTPTPNRFVGVGGCCQIYGIGLFLWSVPFAFMSVIQDLSRVELIYTAVFLGLFYVAVGSFAVICLFKSGKA